MTTTAERLGGVFIVMIFGCISLGAATMIPDRTQAALVEIVDAFRLVSLGVLWTVGLGLIIALVAGMTLLLYLGWQYARFARGRSDLRQAEVLQAMRDAQLQITVAAPGSQVYASSLGKDVSNLSIYHTPLHLAPGRINGDNSGSERRWAFYQLTQSISHKPETALSLPEPVAVELPDRVDLAHYTGDRTSLRNIFLGIGRMPDGRVQPISAPLETLVHIATGGASGFGKSTFMQALAYQVLASRETPNPVFLDPQAVTFSPFAGDDRLRYPIASEPDLIALILAELVAEMKRRQQLFSRWRGIQNLSQYNQAVDPDDRLSPIPIFFDEFGLVADHRPTAQSAKTLAAGGRKAGLSLIVGTQHWGHDEVSTAFRSNLSTSIQFFARDKAESRILLGDSAAADIVHRGRAFARLPGQPGLIEIQAPDPSAYISDVPELLPETNIQLADLMDRLDGQPEDDPQTIARIIELHRAGESLSRISQQLFGYRNQAKLDFIKTTLAENGLIG